MTSDALASILAYDWPGNVRELQNTIKRAVATSQGARLSSRDLRLVVPEEDVEEPLDLASLRIATEGRALHRAQAIANGNRSEMARLLGVSRPTLYQLLKQHVMEQEVG
jgi:two-component system NtrC family response regulator